jgi:hypothetical protein
MEARVPASVGESGVARRPWASARGPRPGPRARSLVARASGEVVHGKRKVRTIPRRGAPGSSRGSELDGAGCVRLRRGSRSTALRRRRPRRTDRHAGRNVSPDTMVSGGRWRLTRTMAPVPGAGRPATAALVHRRKGRSDALTAPIHATERPSPRLPALPLPRGVVERATAGEPSRPQATVACRQSPTDSYVFSPGRTRAAGPMPISRGVRTHR